MVDTTSCLLPLVSTPQNTVVGILLYCLMDNLLFPVRAKLILRQFVTAALGGMSKVRSAFDSSFGL